MPLRLGCIADDFTGASDLAGELVQAGLRTALILGSEANDIDPDLDAVVVALKTRSCAAAEAIEATLAALDLLQRFDAERVYFKYCSTFDSTPSGNIGPVLAALTRRLDVNFSIACPAFPDNGRTVYQGHLFVGGKLLNRSGMENHPLNPMKEPDLVRVLQEQYPEAVGLLPHLASATQETIQRAADSLRDKGFTVAIADAIDNSGLDRLGAWCTGVRLASGASGLAAGIARALSGAGASRPAPLPHLQGRRIILAGSCSRATLDQIDHVAGLYPSLHVLPGSTTTKDILEWVGEQPADAPVLIYSSQTPDVIAGRGSDRPDGAAIEALLSDTAAMLFETGTDAMIVAGGETSGAVVQRLGLDRLHIGPEIAPGVPWTTAHRHGRPVVLALKSGNFGGVNFFSEAWRHLP